KGNRGQGWSAKVTEMSLQRRRRIGRGAEAPALALFLELFFFRRAEAGRRAKRFAVIVERQIAHVKRQRAGRRFLVDDDGDRTAFDAVAERDAAAAGEPSVRE